MRGRDKLVLPGVANAENGAGRDELVSSAFCAAAVSDHRIIYRDQFATVRDRRYRTGIDSRFAKPASPCTFLSFSALNDAKLIL